MSIAGLLLAVTGLAGPQVRWLPPPQRLPVLLPRPSGVAPRTASNPHILYLNFDGGTLRGSPDCSDAPGRCTFLIGQSSATIPAFHGSDDVKQAVVDQLKVFLDPFNVQIVTTRPASGDYAMTVVGGSANDIGINDPAGSILGLAPLDCTDTNPDDIAFAFAGAIGG